MEKEKVPDSKIKKTGDFKNRQNYLEFDDNYTKNRIDLSNIVSNNEKIYNEMKAKSMNQKKVIRLRENSPDFVDDLEVPPLS